jgi:predicted nucleotidyltransferase/DNA-binding CsgD family transcriptional regulator
MFEKSNLFSKTEAKVLDFISRSESELYEKEIAKKVGISISTANLILNSFAKLGLVSKTKKGRMSFYLASANNPALKQFKVYNNINSLMPVIKKLSPLSKRIVLFGSCAGGTNTRRSDVDLMVISSEKDRLRRILDEYPNIQAVIMNSLEWASLSKKDKPFYDRITRGIVLWEDGHES